MAGCISLHDGTVDRTTNGKGAVKDMDFETVRGLDAGSKYSEDFAGEKVPTFEEILELCRGKINIYLDHKEGSIPKIAEAIAKAGMMQQVVIYDGPGECQDWKRVAPQIPVMCGLPDEYQDQRGGGIAKFMEVSPTEVLDGGLQEWTAERVAQAHAAGAKVYVDCLSLFDQKAGFEKAIEMGVDGIQTDHPDRLLQVPGVRP